MDTHTSNPSSANSTDNDELKKEYDQWLKTHSRMLESSTTDGRDYLKHASTLLVLLEGVSELHPIARGVVSSFKTVVIFEQERRENDARVSSVLLAQTDMMRVLLDVDDVKNQRRTRWPTTENIRSTGQLGSILSAMEKEIKDCGNSIDTYYKEIRLVKFWKAQDWKKRMLDHISQFNQLSMNLQRTLSIQVASGVEDLALKMNIILSHLFSSKQDWEKTLDKKIRNLGPLATWIDHPETLRSLILDTKDQAFSFSPQPENSTTGDTNSKAATKNAKKAQGFLADKQLADVMKELGTPLDTLCDRNKEMFELKLNFHTQRLEQSIKQSEQTVIKALSGPSDRLVHEDLRQLWKEMNWIFCVEKNTFVTAVFEFYLDRFSGKRHVPCTDLADLEDEDISGPEKERGAWERSQGTRSSNLSTTTVLQLLHPDAWTLSYISSYSDGITQAIDNDGTGFIRISEANAFSRKIPTGWTLPQWCAYCAAGWKYEAAIYRARISKIMSTLTEMQAAVLGSNRGYLFNFSSTVYEIICHAFIQEPLGQDIPKVAPELHELVKRKVIDQDDACRKDLKNIAWRISDVSMLNLIFPSMMPEEYILQICALMLEQVLCVAEECRNDTIDILEWTRLNAAFVAMRELSAKRIFELAGQGQNILVYHAGIWSRLGNFVPQQDLWNQRYDASMLEGFSVSQIYAASSYLQYPTWKQHMKKTKQQGIPSVIPKSWSAGSETDYENATDRTYFSMFPSDNWFCDRDQHVSKPQRRYRCISPICHDRCIDFCQDCYQLPAAQHSIFKHTYNHPVMLVALEYLPYQHQLIESEAVAFIDQLREDYHARQRYEYYSHAPLSTTFHEATTAPEEESPDEDSDMLQFGTEEGMWNFNEHHPTSQGAPNAPEGSPSDLDEMLSFARTVGGLWNSNEDRPTSSREMSSPDCMRCKRCDSVISLEHSFFVCIGHSCKDYFLCTECAFNQETNTPNVSHDHQMWHTLLCLHGEQISGAWDDIHDTEISKGAVEGAAVVQNPEGSISARITRIENILAAMQSGDSSLTAAIKSLEAKVDSVMAGLSEVLSTHSGGKKDTSLQFSAPQSEFEQAQRQIDGTEMSKHPVEGLDYGAMRLSHHEYNGDTMGPDDKALDSEVNDRNDDQDRGNDQYRNDEHIRNDDPDGDEDQNGGMGEGEGEGERESEGELERGAEGYGGDDQREEGSEGTDD